MARCSEYDGLCVRYRIVGRVDVVIKQSRFDWIVPSVFFFQAEDGIRDLVRSRGLGDVYKRQIIYIG